MFNFAPPYPPPMYDHMRTSYFGSENNPMHNPSSSGISDEGEEEESSNA